MGDEADAIMDRAMFEYYEREFRPRHRGYQHRTGRHCWRNADGIILDMYSMSTEHLRNAAEVCKRNGNTGKLADIEQVLEERERGRASSLADLRARCGD